MAQPLEPLRMLATLRSQGTTFVLVGGLAAAARGGPIETDDVDIAIPRDEENYRRVASALRQLAAIPIGPDAPDRSSYLTNWGGLDLIELGDEFGGLYDRANEEDLGHGVSCRVASPDDLIALTKLSGDLAAVVNLVSLHEEGALRVSTRASTHEDEFGPTSVLRGPRWFTKMWSAFEDVDEFLVRKVYGEHASR
jgi:hypothetical protein